MIHFLRLAGLVAVLAASQAQAGPWPRGEGNTFLSFGYEGTLDLEKLPLYVFSHEAALYAEYGTGPRTTVGIDASAGTDGDYTAIAFFRRTVTASDQRNQFAVTFGGGRRTDGNGDMLLALLGASWGRGYETRHGGGWMTVDTSVRVWETGDIVYKIDGTVGYRPSDDWALIGQVQVSKYPQSPTDLRLSTSVVRSLSDRYSVELAGFYGLGDGRRTGIAVKLWAEF